jgi:hypothetical protein
MSTPKTKAKPADSAPANSKGNLPGSKGVSTAQQKQFSAVVGSIAKRYGVKVASASTPGKNPYAMSPEQAAKVALQAGIITQAGNLTRTFK